MTSQNNPINSSRGSALIVTILLVSVLLGTALILLQRIVPYAKSVRSMHDASQAYYTARGQVDIARLAFLYSGGNPVALHLPSVFGLLSQNMNTASVVPQIKRRNLAGGRRSNTDLVGETVKEIEFPPNTGIRIVSVALPFIDLSSGVKANTFGSAYAISSISSQNPLKIKLFSTDTSVVNFGTSKSNSEYHTLYSRNSGGLRFDMRGVATSAIDFTLKLKFGTMPTSGTITMKMQYFDANSTVDAHVKTFVREYSIATSQEIDLTNSDAPLGNIQSIDAPGSIKPDNKNYHDFLETSDCATADICSISFILSNPSADQSVDFQLISSTPIPDLNAVVIGDGLSNNKLYYQRIIDLIPTPQDI